MISLSGGVLVGVSTARHVFHIGEKDHCKLISIFTRAGRSKGSE